MCGVVSIVYPKHNPALGREAGQLVRHLEYRGYDSTGVATIAEDGRISLRKGVGAPSRVVPELAIDEMAGQKAIGQVRWATYGSVTDANAQPHEVACRVHMVGAHNGNISNTDALKVFLVESGHRVASDNDGEMLVHVVEHFFAEEGGLEAADLGARWAAAVRAIRRADATVDGSYAACVAFPGLPGVFAMKAGSSLYAGVGSDEGGAYAVVSSDLTSVLSKTNQLIPLAEGEGLHVDHDRVRAFALRGEPREWEPSPRLSRLDVRDVTLQPPYRFFMEQEIAQAASNLEPMVRTYFPAGPGAADERTARVRADKARLLARLRESRHVYLVGSGTSYHAGLIGSVFLAGFGGIAAPAVNPGLFRSSVLPALSEGDLVVGITQSGETKDLVDVFDEVRERCGRGVHVVSLVNNENSTIPQEKSDFFLPLLCGPEIAVAATKSFISQIALLYLLARSLRDDDATVAREIGRIRGLIETTLEVTGDAVAEVARDLAQRPSLHVLGASLLGLAREGALKVREVVLNHAEGYDAAEFKHGPNTILGKNTVFGWPELQRAHADGAAGQPLDAERYFSSYPLVFVCPPDEREVRITISQIHTHKIRGADVVVIAEEHAELRRAAEGRPDRPGAYRSRYVVVPPSGDRHAFVFQAAVVLQQLALQMSILKMEALDAAGVRDHGVHPDVPKNVSKSITVD